jgi:hypothetical protein
MYDPTPGMRDTARDFGVLPWASHHDGKLAHKIRCITAPEILAKQVRFPGRVDAPRTRSTPPPAEVREGETLQIPFPARAPQTQKTRVRNPGMAKTQPPENIDDKIRLKK